MLLPEVLTAMRGLTKRQAQRCEDARSKRCRCRCEGKLHGVNRGDVTELDESDAHHAEPPKERRSTKGPR
jgi:hypothetical protein